MAKINSTNTSKENDNNDVTQLIQEMSERLAKIEQENQDLKSKVDNKDKIIDAKKRFEGPATFTFKLWGDVPVCSYVSKRKDFSKDLVYKNQFGDYVSNHVMELTLANKKTVEVDVIDFGKGFIKSNPMTAKDQNGNVIMVSKTGLVGDPQSFTFETEEYGTFTISKQLIN